MAQEAPPRNATRPPVRAIVRYGFDRRSPPCLVAHRRHLRLATLRAVPDPRSALLLARPGRLRTGKPQPSSCRESSTPRARRSCGSSTPDMGRSVFLFPTWRAPQSAAERPLGARRIHRSGFGPIASRCALTERQPAAFVKLRGRRHGALGADRRRRHHSGSAAESRLPACPCWPASSRRKRGPSGRSRPPGCSA